MPVWRVSWLSGTYGPFAVVKALRAKRLGVCILAAALLVWLFFRLAWSPHPRFAWVLSPGYLGDVVRRLLGASNEGALNTVLFFASNIAVWTVILYVVATLVARRRSRTAGG